MRLNIPSTLLVSTLVVLGVTTLSIIGISYAVDKISRMEPDLRLAHTPGAEPGQIRQLGRNILGPGQPPEAFGNSRPRSPGGMFDGPDKHNVHRRIQRGGAEREFERGPNLQDLRRRTAPSAPPGMGRGYPRDPRPSGPKGAFMPPPNTRDSGESPPSNRDMFDPEIPPRGQMFDSSQMPPPGYFPPQYFEPPNGMNGYQDENEFDEDGMEYFDYDYDDYFDLQGKKIEGDHESRSLAKGNDDAYYELDLDGVEDVHENNNLIEDDYLYDYYE